jgi:hypothetical protein
MGAEVLKSPSFAMSVYAVRRLKIAQRQYFDTPVTAFLTDTRLVACCCFGVTHGHRRADAFGRFQDGHRIRTSDVIAVESNGDFWSVHTQTGSHYVIVTFDRHGGRKSVDTFLALMARGVHATASRFQ